MTRWEYKFISTVIEHRALLDAPQRDREVTTKLTAQLNELGAEGWEVVGAVPLLPRNGTETFQKLLLKRLVPDIRVSPPPPQPRG